MSYRPPTKRQKDDQARRLLAMRLGKERAARAAGLLDEPHDWAHGVLRLLRPRGNVYWRPLIDDGDALRLAVKLRMSIDTALGQSLAIALNGEDRIEPHQGDPYAATRRAIVRAAAAMADGEK